MLIPKIAFRNIFRQKKRSIFTGLAIMGGFALSSISIGWGVGAYSNIIEIFTNNELGQIQIHAQGYLDKPSLYKSVKHFEEVGKKLNEMPEVIKWAPRIYTGALASVGEKSAGVQLIGIDPERENIATNFEKKIIEGKLFKKNHYKHIVIGQGLRNLLKTGVGQEIVLISQAADGSMANNVYKISGIMKSDSGAVKDRMSLYMNILEAQNFLVMYNKAHEIVIMIEDINRVRKTASTISKKLDDPGLDVQPWQVFAKYFYDAMKADLNGMWISLFVIILMVSIGVLNTVLMSVLERRKEYGLLKALGTNPKQIFMLVMYEVTILTFISMFVGSIISTGFNYYLSVVGFDLGMEFSYGGMSFGQMYGTITADSYYIPAIAVLFSAWIVSLFPAISAARVDPAKTMRTQ
ncbi:ABC transporter permease [Elusimicrobiota bacterium]